MSSLFRKEVLEARRNQWLGGISFAQPVRAWILGVFAFLVAGAVVLFLVFGEYTRRSRVSGQLVPTGGLVTVMAPSAGVVERLLVDEGMAVRQHEALATVVVPRALSSGEDVAAALDETLRQRQQSLAREARSRDDQIAAQLEGIERRLSLATGELEAIEQEAATQDDQVRLARDMLARHRRLSNEHYVSELQLQQQEQALLDRVASRQTLERQARTTRRLIAQLEQSLAELAAEREAEAATVEQELAAIARERIQARTGAEILVKAPGAGVVASRSVEPGQAVQAGQPLLTLLPEDSRLEARLLLPSRAIGFVDLGDTVLLRYQAFPHQKFGHHRGTVTQVSRSALTGSELRTLTGSDQPAEPFYRVRVALEAESIMAYGKPEPLKPGMLVEADVLGESRKLYEWVLEPLYSVYGAVGDGP